MEIRIVPEQVMVETTEPNVHQDPNNPDVIHVSYMARLRPTGKFNIHITGATEAEVQKIMGAAKRSDRETAQAAERFAAFEADIPANARRVPPGLKLSTCVRCRHPRQVNSGGVCYRCHVESNLEEWARQTGSGWRPGDPHPDWCDCQGLGEHPNRDGSSRGMN